MFIRRDKNSIINFLKQRSPIVLNETRKKKFYEHMPHCATANRLSLPRMLHTPVHWLSVHQSEPKLGMQLGYLYRINIQSSRGKCATIFWHAKANCSSSSQIQRVLTCHSVLCAEVCSQF